MEVPYLPIDPEDVGRNYEAIIRINSQSGKGGMAYIMEQEFGCKLPKAMHPEFGKAVQKIADQTGEELQAPQLWSVFESNYLNQNAPIELIDYSLNQDTAASVNCSLNVNYKVKLIHLQGLEMGLLMLAKKH